LKYISCTQLLEVVTIVGHDVSSAWTRSWSHIVNPYAMIVMATANKILVGCW